MTELAFTKMEGLGNDFIVVEGPYRPATGEVADLCDRRRGIGADGVLAVTPGAPVRMDYWNADGSRAEMCGNGLRCVARYATDRGWVETSAFDVDTPAGTLRVEIQEELVRAEIGRPALLGHETVEGARYVLVDVGNPHAVGVVDDPGEVDVASLGPMVAREAGFDAGCNVEFIAVSESGVDMRVWERGSGETLACGTGMVAAAAVALEGRDGLIQVTVPGGMATVEIEAGSAWLTGPADYVFRGTWVRSSGGRR